MGAEGSERGKEGGMKEKERLSEKKKGRERREQKVDRKRGRQVIGR